MTTPPPVVHVVALVGDRGQFGGPASVALGLTTELASRGRAVALVALAAGRVSRPPGIPPNAWRLLPARRALPGVGMLGLFNLRLISTLWRALRPGTVVHVHAGRDLVSVVALMVAWLRRTPVVAQTHGMVQPRTSWRTRAFDALFVRLLGRSRSILVLTEAERADLTSLVGETSLRLIANGVELPELQPPRAGVPVVLFAARLHPVKGVLTFAGAARSLVAQGVDAEFVVYGSDQGELAPLLQAIRDPSLQGRLRYAGALDHEQMARRIAEADVFVLPSLVDWAPMAVLEAMAAGVATVSSTTSGLATPIAQSHAGVLVSPDVASVAAGIGTLLADPGLRSEVARRGRDLVERSFSVVTVTDELEQIYLSVR